MQEEITGEDFFYRMMTNYGKRRRTRLKGYYCCPICDNQIITRRNYKTKKCPVCGHENPLVSVVDETAVEYIKETSLGILEETVIGFERKEIFEYQVAFIYRQDVCKENKKFAKKEVIKELRKE